MGKNRKFIKKNLQRSLKKPLDNWIYIIVWVCNTVIPIGGWSLSIPRRAKPSFCFKRGIARQRAAKETLVVTKALLSFAFCAGKKSVFSLIHSEIDAVSGNSVDFSGTFGKVFISLKSYKKATNTARYNAWIVL